MNKICTVTANVFNSDKGLGYTSLRIIGMFKKPTPKFYNKVVDEFLDILDTTYNDIHKVINQYEYGSISEFKNDIISRFCDICFDCDRDNTRYHTLFTTDSISIQISVIPVSKLDDTVFGFNTINKSDISNKSCYLENLCGIYNREEDTYKM